MANDRQQLLLGSLQGVQAGVHSSYVHVRAPDKPIPYCPPLTQPKGPCFTMPLQASPDYLARVLQEVEIRCDRSDRWCLFLPVLEDSKDGKTLTGKEIILDNVNAVADLVLEWSSCSDLKIHLCNGKRDHLSPSGSDSESEPES